MNLLEIYLIISTIVLVFAGVCWNTGGINKAIRTGIFLTAILGGFLALSSIGFALGVE